MDMNLLKQVVGELSALLPGSIVERIYEGTDRALYLSLRKQRLDLVLLMSPDRSLPRMHLVSNRPPSAGKMSAFAQYLKSRISASRIERISLLGVDRLVEIMFSGMDADYCLVFELFGSRANMLLLDSSSKIISVYYSSGISGSSKRILAPGFLYEPPEKTTGAEPDPDKTETSRTIRCFALAPAGQGTDISANRRAEQHYNRLLDEQKFSAMRRRVIAHAKRLIAKAERKIRAISSDLEQSHKAEEYRRMGEMLLAHIKDVAPGAERFEFIDESGRNIVAPLDPSLSPASNAGLYFKKYKKAKAGRDVIIARLDIARQEEEGLRSLLREIEKARDANALERIVDRSVLTRAVCPDSGKEQTRQEKKDRLPGVKRINFKGWEMLVGKSAAGNDHICTKIAMPDDIWLHAEGMPGSHVLIKNIKRVDVPEEVILKAASIAAYYSKGRNSTKVPVTYTKAVHVKKPKGARPGSVTLTERRTIMVQPESGADAMSIDK